MLNFSAEVSCQDLTDSLNTEHIYSFAGIQPEPIGGYASLYQDIASVLKYPSSRICVEGKVYIGFIVETNGSVSNIEVVKSLHPKFDEEAIRTFNEVFTVTKYAPGTMDGVPIRVRMILPIYFKMAN